MPALCDCGRSACRARSKHSEHRRLATAPSTSPLRRAARAQETSHPGQRPARAFAGLGGRLSAAAGQHASNCLHQLLRAALLGLAAAPARRTAARPRRSACETARCLSLTAGAATKTVLSQRCGLPPPLCRPCHGIFLPETDLQARTALARRPVIQTDPGRLAGAISNNEASWCRDALVLGK